MPSLYLLLCTYSILYTEDDKCERIENTQVVLLERTDYTHTMMER